jgi:hypothetical protein
VQHLTLSVHTSLNNCAIEMIQRGKLIFIVLAMHYEPLNHADRAIIDLFMAVQCLLGVGTSVVACGRTPGGCISPPINSIPIRELIRFALPIYFACLIMYIGPLVPYFMVFIGLQILVGQH